MAVRVSDIVLGLALQESVSSSLQLQNFEKIHRGSRCQKLRQPKECGVSGLTFCLQKLVEVEW